LDKQVLVVDGDYGSLVSKIWRRWSYYPFGYVDVVSWLPILYCHLDCTVGFNHSQFVYPETLQVILSPVLYRRFRIDHIM